MGRRPVDWEPTDHRGTRERRSARPVWRFLARLLPREACAFANQQRAAAAKLAGRRGGGGSGGGGRGVDARTAGGSTAPAKRSGACRPPARHTAARDGRVVGAWGGVPVRRAARPREAAASARRHSPVCLGPCLF